MVLKRVDWLEAPLAVLLVSQKVVQMVDRSDALLEQQLVAKMEMMSVVLSVA